MYVVIIGTGASELVDEVPRLEKGRVKKGDMIVHTSRLTTAEVSAADGARCRPFEPCLTG